MRGSSKNHPAVRIESGCYWPFWREKRRPAVARWIDGRSKNMEMFQFFTEMIVLGSFTWYVNNQPRIFLPTDLLAY